MANTAEINKALKSCSVTSPFFTGCFPADLIPTPTRYPVALIANTDGMNESGTHWVAFYSDSENEIEFFDSFGKLPDEYPQFNYFINHFDTIRYNGERLQQYFSSTCGYYCMMFLYLRCKKLQFEDIVYIFTDNYKDNDQGVTAFINHRWKFNKSIYSNSQRFQMSKKFLPS